jgi:hypothetical protein
MNGPQDPATPRPAAAPEGTPRPHAHDRPDGPASKRPTPGSAPRDAAHQRHPVDPAEESATGEEDPGAALDVSMPAPRGP